MAVKPVATMKPQSTDLQIEDQIRRRAQELYERRNPADGTALDDWLQAEKEVLSQTQRKKTATASN